MMDCADNDSIQCEHDKEASGSIKREEIEQLSDYQVLQN
jgi:hypothetical protein